MSAGKKKRLPVGIDKFEKIREEGFYYIDKTGFIRDLLHKWGEVNLFTRPRRFGKSLSSIFWSLAVRRSFLTGLKSRRTQSFAKSIWVSIL